MPICSHFFLAPVECQYGIIKVWRMRRTIQAKDVVIVATIRACEGAHVLYHAKYVDVDFPEEIYASHGIAECEILRR